jgi:hypothetical protein
MAPWPSGLCSKSGRMPTMATCYMIGLVPKTKLHKYSDMRGFLLSPCNMFAAARERQLGYLSNSHGGFPPAGWWPQER